MDALTDILIIHSDRQFWPRNLSESLSDRNFRSTALSIQVIHSDQQINMDEFRSDWWFWQVWAMYVLQTVSWHRKRRQHVYSAKFSGRSCSFFRLWSCPATCQWSLKFLSLRRWRVHFGAGRGPKAPGVFSFLGLRRWSKECTLGPSGTKAPMVFEICFACGALKDDNSIKPLITIYIFWWSRLVFEVFFYKSRFFFGAFRAY